MFITSAAASRRHSLTFALLGVVAVVALTAAPTGADTLTATAPDPAPSATDAPAGDRLPNDWGTGSITPDVRAVAYDPANRDADHMGDLYLPRAGGNRGVLIVVHGGGFTSGERADLHRYLGPLLGQLDRGLAILTISYRFDPFPAAVLDLDAAIRFVRGPGGAALGLNPATVLVAGHSAGGTITANLALAADRGDVAPYGQLSKVDGWMTVAAPLDLDATLPFGRGARDAWRAGDESAASPVANLSAGDPPGLMIHGDRDRVVPADHARRMQSRAVRLGVDLPDLDLVGDAPSSCRGHAPMCGASISEIDSFVDRVVGSAV